MERMFSITLARLSRLAGCSPVLQSPNSFYDNTSEVRSLFEQSEHTQSYAYHRIFDNLLAFPVGVVLKGFSKLRFCLWLRRTNGRNEAIGFRCRSLQGNCDSSRVRKTPLEQLAWKWHHNAVNVASDGAGQALLTPAPHSRSVCRLLPHVDWDWSRRS